MKLLTGFLSFAAAMLAQGDSGRITGRVLDPTGAVVMVLFTALGGDHLVMEPLQRFSS